MKSLKKGKNVTIIIILLFFSIYFHFRENCALELGKNEFPLTDKKMPKLKQPKLNSYISECLDCVIIDDQIITSTRTVIRTRNISKIKTTNFETNFYGSNIAYKFYNNDSMIFVAIQNHRSSNKSNIGYLQSNNISNIQFIFGTNLSYISAIFQFDNNLVLFGEKQHLIQYEIYNLTSLMNPTLIHSDNFSTYSPPYYEYYQYKFHLSFQKYNQYIYHSTINNTLQIWDFNNLSSPFLVKELNSNYSNVYFEEKVMYALSESKFVVFNNSDPLQPLAISNYEIDSPRAIAIENDKIIVISEREIFLLDKSVITELILEDYYILKNRVDLQFYKVITKDNYIFILTEEYTTDSFDTQTDLFIFEFNSRNKIGLLYPKIRLSIGFQLFLMYLAFSSPFILIFIIVAISTYFIIKNIKKKRKKLKNTVIEED